MDRAPVAPEGSRSWGPGVAAKPVPESPRGELGGPLMEAIRRPSGVDASGFPIRQWVTERWHSDPRPGEVGWGPAEPRRDRSPVNRSGVCGKTR
jgi:hypothetical protein